jgi:hypothetical protein
MEQGAGIVDEGVQRVIGGGHPLHEGRNGVCIAEIDLGRMDVTAAPTCFGSPRCSI